MSASDTLLRAAQLLRWCAESVRTHATANELERFPYIPEMEEVADELERLTKENEALRKALEDAADALYNGFEPNNQSTAYMRARVALAAREGV